MYPGTRVIYIYFVNEFIVREERIENPEVAKTPIFYVQLLANTEVALCQRLKRAGFKFINVYDFRDFWEHEVIYKKRLPFDENQPLPPISVIFNSTPLNNFQAKGYLKRKGDRFRIKILQ